MAGRFALVSAGVNLVALLVFLIPGINATVFLFANGYLLGREYFELAALRYHPLAEVQAMRQAYAGRIYLAGLVIALFVAVPLLNLLTPLFATAFMVRMHRDIAMRGSP